MYMQHIALAYVRCTTCFTWCLCLCVCGCIAHIWFAQLVMMLPSFRKLENFRVLSLICLQLDVAGLKVLCLWLRCRMAMTAMTTSGSSWRLELFIVDSVFDVSKNGSLLEYTLRFLLSIVSWREQQNYKTCFWMKWAHVWNVYVSSEAGMDFDSTPDPILGNDSEWMHPGGNVQRFFFMPYQDIMDIKREDMVACLGQAFLCSSSK